MSCVRTCRTVLAYSEKKFRNCMSLRKPSFDLGKSDRNVIRYFCVGQKSPENSKAGHRLSFEEWKTALLAFLITVGCGIAIDLIDEQKIPVSMEQMIFDVAMGTTEEVSSHRHPMESRFYFQQLDDNGSSAKKILPFPKVGVRLSVLDEFVMHCGGHEALRGLTTTEVCEKYLKPMTKSSRFSYCELLQSKGHPHVLPASVFISHAWKFQFLDVLQALKHHFRNQGDIVIWFDLFSNNQHSAPDLDFHWWSTTFKTAIAQFGHTVLVLAPWEDPIPLTRAWCLFEIFCSVETGSKFEIAMSHSEHSSFIDKIKTDYSAVNRMIARVDARNSEAWNPADKDRIFEAVSNTVGFDSINAIVLTQIRTWVITAVKKALRTAKDDLENARLMMLEGRLLQDQGRFDEAEPLMKECVQIYRMKYGPSHPETIACLNNLATLYYAEGHLTDAESLMEECLRLKKEVNGDIITADMLVSMSNLASMYYAQGRLSEAKPLVEVCHTERKRTLGPDHPSTLTSLNNLAGLYTSLGRYTEADALYHECVNLKRAKLGADHPDTLISISNLVNLYQLKGELEQAERAMNECLRVSRAKLGAVHPITVMAEKKLLGIHAAKNAAVNGAKNGAK